jgi:hypothetical protein
MNVFFVYFSILRAYERGYRWQKLFALACLVQFLVEVVFYETTECAMVHFLIPDLVRAEVQGAGVALRNIVSQLCTSQSLGRTSSSSLSSPSAAAHVMLDAPQYLFVSANVAKSYPDLLESVLIRSYHTCWPGPYATKWKFDHFSDTRLFLTNVGLSNRSGRGGGGSTDIFRTFSVTMILISLLKEFGASAPVLQRLLLHSIQPLLVAAIFFVGSVFLLQPLYWLLLIPVVLYAAYSYHKYQWEVSQDSQEGGGDIYPLKDFKEPQSSLETMTTTEHKQQSSPLEVPNLPPVPPPESKLHLPILSASRRVSSPCAVEEDKEDELNLEFGLGDAFDDPSSDSIWDDSDEEELGDDEEFSSVYSHRGRLSSDSYLYSNHRHHDRDHGGGSDVAAGASNVYSSNNTLDSPSEDQEEQEQQELEVSDSSLDSLDEDDEEDDYASTSLSDGNLY